MYTPISQETLSVQNRYMYSVARKKGNIAEDITEQYLKDNGFTILERNYLRKWGEIDIITKKSNRIHFIEVKSIFFPFYTYALQQGISREIPNIDWKIAVIDDNNTVSREMGVSCETDLLFDPTWNMTKSKKKRFSKAIRSYLAENYKEDIPDFQVDLMAISLDNSRKISYIQRIDNILLEEL